MFSKKLATGKLAYLPVKTKRIQEFILVIKGKQNQS